MISLLITCKVLSGRSQYLRGGRLKRKSKGKKKDGKRGKGGAGSGTVLHLGEDRQDFFLSPREVTVHRQAVACLWCVASEHAFQSKLAVSPSVEEGFVDGLWSTVVSPASLGSGFATARAGRRDQLGLSFPHHLLAPLSSLS